MSRYIITPIEDEDYSCIVTVLDYMTPYQSIYDYLWSVDSLQGKKVVVDTACLGGSGLYRFFTIEVSGDIDSADSEARYVVVSGYISYLANRILRKYPKYIVSSTLPEYKKKEILEDDSLSTVLPEDSISKLLNKILPCKVLYYEEDLSGFIRMGVDTSYGILSVGRYIDNTSGKQEITMDFNSEFHGYDKITKSIQFYQSSGDKIVQVIDTIKYFLQKKYSMS